MFSWPEVLDREHYKLLRRDVVRKIYEGNIYEGIWRELSFSARAVYPVLLRHRGVDDRAFPSEERLAAMSGVTAKTVRKAIREFAPYFQIRIRKKISLRGNYQNEYIFPHEPQPRPYQSMPFYSSIVDSSLWAQMKPVERSMYITMRAFSSPRPDLEEDGEWLSEDDYVDYLLERMFDYCSANPDVLCHFSGIRQSSFHEATASMIRHGLLCDCLESEDGCRWKIAVRPEDFRESEELDKILMSKRTQLPTKDREKDREKDRGRRRRHECRLSPS